MKKILFIIFLVFMSFSINKLTFADTLSDKVWGTKDCSMHSTKTLAGLNDFVRCKKGLEPRDKSFFKSLKWKKKDKEKFDPTIPCEEYSTKTITGLSKRIKCKRAQKN